MRPNCARFATGYRLGRSVLVLGLLGCSPEPSTALTPPLQSFLQPDKADGLPSRLRPVGDHKLHVDEPSDLLFVGGHLYTVSDSHSKIYEIDPDGDVRHELDIEGHDLEALAIDPSGELMIADETRGRIWRIAADGHRHDPIDVPDARDGNSGIEGLTFDHAGHLLVGKEKDPAVIFELDAAGHELARAKFTLASDLSALTYNRLDHHVYALSDEEHTLFRLDAAGRATAAWRLPITSPEGVAFDGARVYIASDGEARLYVFELE